MGFFSTLCEGCGHPLLSDHATNYINYWMNQAVAISADGTVTCGIYDGYGRLLDDDDYGEHDMDETDTTWHWPCWNAAFQPIEYTGPSEQAPDQGFFFDDPDHNLPYPEQP